MNVRVLLEISCFCMISLLIRNDENFNLFKITCYDEHDFDIFEYIFEILKISHVTTNMIFTIAFRNCKISKRDAKFDDFLRTFSFFCIQLKCDVELFLLLIFMRQLYRTISNSYIRCDDNDSQWQIFIAFDAITTIRNDDFVIFCFFEIKRKT